MHVFILEDPTVLLKYHELISFFQKSVLSRFIGKSTKFPKFAASEKEAKYERKIS